MHPTDFSAASMNAFAHALKIALAVRAKLYIAHITGQKDADYWSDFPHIRETLTRWGLFDADEPAAAIFGKLGVEVVKVEIASGEAVRGIERFLGSHRSHLIVLATHGREGLARWIEPSIAEAMSRRARTQTLFVPEHCSGFVEAATGRLTLDRVLVPVDHDPPAEEAIRATQWLCGTLGRAPSLQFLHVGGNPPVLDENGEVELGRGSAVDGILEAATQRRANLIAMATRGHRGILDAIRGSTTERVLRHAPCPVLAVPITSL